MCNPAEALTGQVVCSTAVPLASAVATPITMGSDWKMKVTSVPGAAPVTVSVTGAPGVQLPPSLDTSDVGRGYWASAGTATSSRRAAAATVPATKRLSMRSSAP